MKVQEVLQKTTQFFKNKAIASARLDSELLLSRALGWTRVELYLKSDYPINEEELSRCRELVRRRASGEPVAYIFGEKEFYGRNFEVSSDVLIPRPETEHLVDAALEFAKLYKAVKIVDLGTGSGCIGLTLLCEIPEAQLLTCDISAQALEVAKRNGERLQVTERAHFIHQSAEDLTLVQVQDALDGFADLLVANPPYIRLDDPAVDPSVRKFEPQIALFSGDQGLSHLRAWLAVASKILRPGGLCLFEMGTSQGKQVAEMAAHAFEKIDIIKDYAGHDRVLRGFKKGD